MRKILVLFWPYAMILVFVAIFFYPVWLKGQVPLPADIVVGVYYPWLDYKWGYPAGVPVKNPITSDVVSFTFPMQTYAVDLLKQGHFPLWNPLILTGTPLLANFQSAPFSPTNIFYFFLNQLNAWSLQITLQLFLAALFCYFLLREFGGSKLASLVGGLFFALSGFMIIWLEWNGHSLTGAFFPLVFFLTWKWLKTEKFRWGMILSFTLALQIFSGYPQIIIYQFLSLILLVLILDRQTIFQFKKILGLALFILIGVGLSAIQILPALELLSLSQRKVEDVINVSAFLPWQMIITFFAPDYFGNHTTRNYWGPGDYTLVAGFSGVVVTTLAAVGFLTFFKNKFVRFAAALVGLSFLIAFPNPLTSALKDSGLLGLQAASAHRALVLSNLGFAALAAFGLDSVLNQKINLKSLRALYLPGIILFSFLMGTTLSLWWIKTLGADVTNLTVGLRNLILPIFLFVCTVATLLLNLKIRKLNKISAIILIFLALIELFRFGWKYTPFNPKNLTFPQTPVIDYLQKQLPPFRVVAEDVVPINLLMPYGLERVEGYDAVYPLQFAKYLSVINSGNVDLSPMGRYGSVNNIDSNLIHLSNAKFVLALKRKGQIPKKFQKPYLKKVFEDKSVVILQNEKALPRAKMFYQWERVTGGKNVLDRLLYGDFPIDQKLIIEEQLDLEQQPGEGMVEYQSLASEKNLKIQTTAGGLLYIADSFYPGWQAFVDGQEVKIIKANHNFMAIPMQRGEHQVKIIYKPSSFEIGKWISLFSLFALVLCYYLVKEA